MSSRTSSENNPRPRSALAAILWGGAACGVFDLLFAILYYGSKGGTSIGILQSIARGLVGSDIAYAGGWSTAALGFLLHFVISFGAAAVFVAAAGRLPWLIRWFLPVGLGYGAVVYFVMNWIVLPLSAFQPGKFPPGTNFAVLIAHLFLVGLPIAAAARWHGRL